MKHLLRFLVIAVVSVDAIAQTAASERRTGSIGADPVHVEPSIFYGGNMSGCPTGCTTVMHKAGEVVYSCTWETYGPKGGTLVSYVPGTMDTKTCTTAGAPLDVEPRHRLFVHGLHGSEQSWEMWFARVKRQMDYLGFKTVKDGTGKTARYGDSSAPLLVHVSELASQINNGFAGLAPGSVEVYAHSLGALKMEALLQLGYKAGLACQFSAACSDPLFTAALKIGRVYVFQGAHGGCDATAVSGDAPLHKRDANGNPALPPLGCPASKSIGFVNDRRRYGGPNFIPDTTEIWDMARIVWSARPPNEQKHIHYVVATSNGGTVCHGKEAFICRDDRPHDGVVYAEQMVPTWYANYPQAVAAGLVTSGLEPGEYCHLIEDEHDPPRRSKNLMTKYVGIKPGFKYLNPGPVKEYVFTEDVTSCDAACFCAANPPGACANRLDCTKQGGKNCSGVSGGGSNNGSGGIFSTARIAAPAAALPEGFAQWVACGKEGERCDFTGPRLVRFGANGKYKLRVATDGTPCSSRVFGDPVPNAAKSCDYQMQ